MINIDFQTNNIKPRYKLPSSKAAIAIAIYLFFSIVAVNFIAAFMRQNPNYIVEYSQTDSLIRTLQTKNGIGIILKDDFEKSIYENPTVDVFDFKVSDPDNPEGEKIYLEPFLEDYLLISSINTFSSSQTKTINESFMKTTFTTSVFLNNNYKVYRYIPKDLSDDSERILELFNYFDISDPVFDAKTNAVKRFNGLASSLMNFISYLFILVGLAFVMFNVINYDLKRTAKTLSATIKAALIGLLILYGANILSNMGSILIQELLQERSVGAANQAMIVETLNSNGSFIMILSVVLLGPIVEELIFRKTIFSFFKNKTFAILLSSLVFGLVHLTNESSLVTALINLPSYLIPGLVFGYIYAKNDENLIAPTLTHILSNAISVILVILL